MECQRKRVKRRGFLHRAGDWQFAQTGYCTRRFKVVQQFFHPVFFCGNTIHVKKNQVPGIGSSAANMVHKIAMAELFIYYMVDVETEMFKYRLLVFGYCLIYIAVVERKYFKRFILPVVKRHSYWFV